MEGGPGRPPRAMAAPRTSGSAPAVATPRLQLSHRVAGERRGEGEGTGREGAMRGSWYRVRVRSSAAPRLGLCSPLNRPPPAARSGADHRRVSLPARRLIRGVLAAPGSPWAVCSLLAACGPQLQARSGLRRRAPQSSRGSAPLRSMPRAGLPRPAPPGSAPGSRRTRLLTKHRFRSPRLSLPSRLRSSSPRSTFPRFLRPARPPPPRPRLLTLPPSPPA